MILIIYGLTSLYIFKGSNELNVVSFILKRTKYFRAYFTDIIKKIEIIVPRFNKFVPWVD